MVAFVIFAIAVVLIILGIALMITFKKDRFDNDEVQVAGGGRVLGGAIVILVGIVVAIVAMGFREIGPGQVGVVTRFGAVQEGTLAPGLQWVPPLISDIKIMDARVQNYNFGGDPNNGGQGIEAFTQEQQPAYLFGVVNYHIDPQFASDLFQRVGEDYFEKVIQHQADTELKQDARLYPVDTITSKRDELASTAQARLAADVTQYHIVIDGIFISQIGLSPEYIKSVTDKQIAQQLVEKAKADAESARQQAHGEADAKVINAQGDADATRKLAEGQRDANNDINASLTANLIQWQAIQKLNPNVNVMLVPSSDGFLFNLDIPQASPAP